MRWASRIALLVLALVVGGCATRSHPPRTEPSPAGHRKVPEGLASFYAQTFDRKITASGMRFNNHAMIAAHPTYPFGTLVRVTNLANGRSVQVRIQDRGPAPGPQAEGVIIDLSFAAAQALGFVHEGRTRVRLNVIRWGS